jgi:hypothetical protein
MSIETGPPALETIQVRLGLCLFLLSSSRANQCWFMFGTTMQLVTALGLHRRRLSKTTRGGPAYVDQELRKRIFWSAYTLDKYLTVMFGRPRLLDDEDTDQDLPDEVNDEDMYLEAPPHFTDATDCMMIASVLHYRLAGFHPSQRQFLTEMLISGWDLSWVRFHADCTPRRRFQLVQYSRLPSSSSQSYRNGSEVYIRSSVAFEPQVSFRLSVDRAMYYSLRIVMQ